MVAWWFVQAVLALPCPLHGTADWMTGHHDTSLNNDTLRNIPLHYRCGHWCRILRRPHHRWYSTRGCDLRGLYNTMMTTYRRRNLWVGWCVSSWWPLFPSRNSVLYIYIYIYIYVLLYEFCFLWFTNCVLLSDDNSLIPGCLWLLAFVSNNTLILGIWCSTIPHLPGCFCPWTFFQNIEFNVVPSDPFMSHLAIQFGYSVGEFLIEMSDSNNNTFVIRGSNTALVCVIWLTI